MLFLLVQIAVLLKALKSKHYAAIIKNYKKYNKNKVNNNNS